MPWLIVHMIRPAIFLAALFLGALVASILSRRHERLAWEREYYGEEVGAPTMPLVPLVPQGRRQRAEGRGYGFRIPGISPILHWLPRGQRLTDCLQTRLILLMHKGGGARAAGRVEGLYKSTSTSKNRPGRHGTVQARSSLLCRS